MGCGSSKTVEIVAGNSKSSIDPNENSLRWKKIIQLSRHQIFSVGDKVHVSDWTGVVK